jgi:hypothetical protein
VHVGFGSRDPETREGDHPRELRVRSQGHGRLVVQLAVDVPRGLPVPVGNQGKLDATFPIASLANKEYTSAQAVGLVGAGQRVTAVGGFVLDERGIPFVVAPGSLTVRLFSTPPALPSSSSSPALACTTAPALASDTVSPDAFYFIWRNGPFQTLVGTELTSGIKYYVAVCNTSNGTLLSGRTLRDRLSSKDLDEQDFYLSW